MARNKEIDASEIDSSAEMDFAQQWVDLFPSVDLVTQVKLIPKRRFRFDFAHFPSQTAIEINGAVYGVRGKDGRRRPGGHGSGPGLLRDYEKSRLAALQGWLTVFLAPQQITEESLRHIAAIIEARTKLLAK